MTADNNNALQFVEDVATLGLDVLAKLTKDASDADFTSNKNILEQILKDIGRHCQISQGNADPAPAAPADNVGQACCSTCLSAYEACVAIHTQSYCEQQYTTCMATCAQGC